MADPHGFMKYRRKEAANRPVPLRLLDFKDVHEHMADSDVETQAARCMDCGVPFCHDGCPLGNIIPEWNDLVRRGRWEEAYNRLHATNNFPEFTGRICPAPCEGACVLGIEGIGAGAGIGEPVAIKTVELQIVEHAYEHGWVKPVTASFSTGQSVAVVGSGPAGLAAAQQLTRAGHRVTVFERDDRIGGLLRYGVPDYKLEARYIDRRIEQMEAEGTIFRTSISPSVEDLAGFDAVVMAVGATVPREVSFAGRELDGVHQAMDYLPQANRVVAGDIEEPEITARGKNVVIIGGGDTGTDCFGTALRQGAASVRQFDYNPTPGRTAPPVIRGRCGRRSGAWPPPMKKASTPSPVTSPPMRSPHWGWRRGPRVSRWVTGTSVSTPWSSPVRTVRSPACTPRSASGRRTAWSTCRAPMS